MKLLKAMVMATAIMMMSQVVMADDSVEVHEMPELVYREPPYANMFSPTSTDVSDIDEELWDIEEFFGVADDSRSGSCTDYCHYNFNSAGVAVEIHCEVPTMFWTNVVVGMNKYNEAGEQVIMCVYNPFQGWVRIGSCDLDGLVKLRVDGSSDDDNIGIIKTETCETDPCDEDNDCDFGDFIDDFGKETSGELTIHGQGDCDWIWGSQYGDTSLTGEYVVGLDGDDDIFMDDDDLTCIDGHPSVLGGDGDDWIMGTGNEDYVWAGDGSDDVYTYARNDLIDLGPGNGDIGVGGTHDDRIWGGPGNSDELNGQDGNDRLLGGTGSTDYCYGGPGYDQCDANCYLRSNCEYY